MANRKAFYVLLFALVLVLMVTSLTIFLRKGRRNKIKWLNEDSVSTFSLREELLSYVSKNPCDKVDAVFTWVNGSDPGFIAEVEKYRGKSSRRYNEYGTLRFAIRSAIKNIPDIRNIYVVTNGQVPSWLATASESSGRVQLVTHKDIFLEKSAGYLPVFNSNSIEIHLRNIPNLTECFLYFNDDFFVNKPISMKHFLRENGSLKIMFDKKYSAPKYSWSSNTWHRSTTHANTVLNKFYHPSNIDTCHRYPCHNVYFLRKSVLKYIHEVWNSDITETASNRFRSDRDIPIFFMHHNVALEEGLGTENLCDTKVVGWRNSHDHNKWAWGKIGGNKYTTFCIQDEFSDQNDGSFVSETKFLEELLCLKYPEKSFAEKEDDVNPCTANRASRSVYDFDDALFEYSGSSSSSDCGCNEART